ncbi:hypothetical protein C8F04DRAFT_1388495 [Mycena alexandri]|uniref:Uncharacterized protein n=1 Tax=Mycena alexandri TaxID=1745969 RepID=A0AAD6TH30_9AGAR|nr:hypothetical protein C8F04DRAFT_1388495 [Mycena alexandri]
MPGTCRSGRMGWEGTQRVVERKGTRARGLAGYPVCVPHTFPAHFRPRPLINDVARCMLPVRARRPVPAPPYPLSPPSFLISDPNPIRAAGGFARARSCAHSPPRLRARSARHLHTPPTSPNALACHVRASSSRAPHHKFCLRAGAPARPEFSRPRTRSCAARHLRRALSPLPARTARSPPRSYLYPSP